MPTSPDDELFPWRQVENFPHLLVTAHSVLADLHVVFPGKGHPPIKIREVEKRLSRPLPPDIAAFYREMIPTEIFEGRKEFGFYDLDQPEFRWQSMEGAETDLDPATSWSNAQGLALGQTEGGDAFWYLINHTRIPDGTIIMLNHEGDYYLDLYFVIHARNFREFLAKILHFKSLCPTEDPLFRQEYLDLNPLPKRS